MASRVFVVALSLTLGLGALTPAPTAAQFAEDPSANNIAKGFLSLVVGITAGYVLYSPEEPTFSVTGAELSTSAGRARLSAYGQPVVIREEARRLRYERVVGRALGNVVELVDDEVSVERRAVVRTVAFSSVKEVTDLRSGASRGRAFRRSMAIGAAGFGGMSWFLSKEVEGSEKLYLQLATGLFAVSAAAIAMVRTDAELASVEQDETGQIALRPNFSWDPDEGVRVGFAGRWRLGR